MSNVRSCKVHATVMRIIFFNVHHQLHNDEDNKKDSIYIYNSLECNEKSLFNDLSYKISQTM